MKKSNKQVRVTFQAVSDAEAVALAKLGISDKFIESETGLTPGQISYRLRKAKDLEHHELGYRQQWRSGKSEVFHSIRQQMLAVLREDIQRTLPGLIVHVVPERETK